ncbi:hypothetical protein CALVIDRAFT_568915 [Calocera viscosa TUFC12733]|uniref:Uncharacterized protein n=1 Tax=Calocera viscosa (strain TUFC12733) TaxID=1330018 RepID=A0A167GHY7_CALVF|nr:hypothetical protein CALVIDRAFT_568915 [Calocera viscosa TUFC12733]
MPSRDIQTVIPLPSSIAGESPPNLAQTWLLHLPADYYMPMPLRLLKRGAFQRLLHDPQAGIRLDHGAAVQVGAQWFYHYRLTFGLLSHAPIVKFLHVPLTAFYSEPPISLSELEAALRLLIIAGSLEGSISATAGFVRKDTVWGWRVLFQSDSGHDVGSFPLASYAQRQHGELAVWEGLRRTGERCVED